MKRFLKSWQLIALSVLVFVGTSCNKEKDEPISKDTKNILIGTRVMNPGGKGGVGYIQLIKNELVPITYDNKKGRQISYSSTVFTDKNDIYVLPGWREIASKIQVYTKQNSELVSKGEIDLPANSGGSGIAIIGNKIYVSYVHMGKIVVIDKAKLEIIKEIDLKEYGVGDENPNPAQMLVRDNILYVGLTQIQPGKFSPDPTRPMADVLLIDTKMDKPIKMITADFANMSMPTRGENYVNSIFKDENDDIYISCSSGWGWLRLDAGLLRIKKGETEFDKSYVFKVTQTNIDGETNKASYITAIQYAGNNIAYATVEIPAYYSKPANWEKDRTTFPVKIDLKAKTIKRLGTQRGNGLGWCVNLYQGKVLFGLSTTTDNGFFVYDPKTDTMSDGAVIKTTGNPMFFLELKE